MKPVQLIILKALSKIAHSLFSISSRVDNRSSIWHSNGRNCKFILNISKNKVDISFWSKALLVFIFITLTPFVIATSIFALYSLKEQDITTTISVSENHENFKLLVSDSFSYPEIETKLDFQDARVELIRKYLTYYNSPLTPFAETIVKESDKNGIDWRLLVAIAQQESNLCKIIPENSFNCWGWGIHSKGTLRFSSYDEAIKTITRGLRKNYIDKGYRTAEEIMRKYTPLSDGSWARGVSQFMEDITQPLE